MWGGRRLWLNCRQCSRLFKHNEDQVDLYFGYDKARLSQTQSKLELDCESQDESKVFLFFFKKDTITPLHFSHWCTSREARHDYRFSITVSENMQLHITLDKKSHTHSYSAAMSRAPGQCLSYPFLLKSSSLHASHKKKRWDTRVRHCCALLRG